MDQRLFASTRAAVESAWSRSANDGCRPTALPCSLSPFAVCCVCGCPTVLSPSRAWSAAAGALCCEPHPRQESTEPHDATLTDAVAILPHCKTESQHCDKASERAAAAATAGHASGAGLGFVSRSRHPSPFSTPPLLSLDLPSLLSRCRICSPSSRRSRSCAPPLCPCRPHRQRRSTRRRRRVLVPHPHHTMGSSGLVDTLCRRLESCHHRRRQNRRA